MKAVIQVISELSKLRYRIVQLGKECCIFLNFYFYFLCVIKCFGFVVLFLPLGEILPSPSFQSWLASLWVREPMNKLCNL